MLPSVNAIYAPSALGPLIQPAEGDHTGHDEVTGHQQYQDDEDEEEEWTDEYHDLALFASIFSAPSLALAGFVFALTGLCTLAGFEPRTAWAVLLLAAVLLARVGGPVELTGADIRRLLCNPSYRLVFTHGARVIGSTVAHPKVSATLTAAVTVRDVTCRFPACGQPAGVCEVHHLTHVADGGPTVLDNLALVCRDHHKAIHDGGWTTTLQPDDTITFTRHGRTLVSLPRVQRRITPTGPPPPGRPHRRHTTPTASSPWASSAPPAAAARAAGDALHPRGWTAHTAGRPPPAPPPPRPRPEPDLPF